MKNYTYVYLVFPSAYPFYSCVSVKALWVMIIPPPPRSISILIKRSFNFKILHLSMNRLICNCKGNFYDQNPNKLKILQVFSLL